MDQEALLTGTAEPLARQRGGGLTECLRRDAPLAALDLGVASFSYLLTLALRFDGSVPDRYWSSFWRFLFIALTVHLVVHQLAGLYGQVWRYASVQEARRVVLAGCASGIGVVTASVLVGLATGGLRALPLSVTIFGAVLTRLGSGALRVGSTVRVSTFTWDPDQPQQKVDGLTQYACAGHRDPCPTGRGFIGDYFGLAISNGTVYPHAVSTHYPSATVRADDGGPVYYQEQVLGTVARAALGI